MITYKRKGLVFGEVYFENVPSDNPKIDILRIINLPNRLVNVKSPAKRGQTIVKNLLKDEQSLFDEMERNTRYEVRRAMSKDNLVFKYDDMCSEHAVQAFCDYYDEFSSVKKLRPVFRQRFQFKIAR